MLSHEKLKFGGYALLIALPAIILAGLGGASLREDRIATAHKMKEGGDQLIDEVLALRDTLDLTGSLVAETVRYTVSFEADGRLLSPVPMDLVPPIGNRSFLADMDSEKARQLLTTLGTTKASRDFDKHWRQIDEFDFSETVLGRLKLRVALKQAETDPDRAEIYFREIGDQYLFANSKLGTPIGVICLLWLVEHGTIDRTLADWIQQLGTRLISRPSLALQEYLIAIENAIAERKSVERSLYDKSSETPVVADLEKKWRGTVRRYRTDQLNRDFFRLAKIELHLDEASPKRSARLSFGGEELLIWMLENNREIVARRFQTVSDEIASALSVIEVNQDFKAKIRIAGLGEARAPAASEVSTGTLRANRLWPACDVEVTLRDPDRYFASVDERRWRFGLLILLSLLSVSVGLVAIYRAFRRQESLNEQRSNFVASVSHELRTPTASISLLTEELMAGDCDTAVYHQMILAESQRLSCLVENVLDVSRIERGAKAYEMESCDFVKLVEASIQSFRPTAQRFEMSIEVERDDQEIDCDIDSVGIQRCLRNLLDNAVKFSSKGQMIVVALGASPVEVWFEVRDKGKGIDSSVQQLIFQPFQRLGSEMRRESVGVGLGLALVKHVVDGHGGRIDLSSEIDEGSVFRISLPRRHQNA